MNKPLIILTVGVLVSCTSPNNKKNVSNNQVITDTLTKSVIETVYINKIDDEHNESDLYIQTRLPEWVFKQGFLDGIDLKNNYVIENRLNPLYLEADFNGDGNIDIALAIKEKATKKVGFVIIHGKTHEIYIIGAGTEIKNGLSDDMDYVDMWKVNREEVNEAGAEENTGTGDKGELILENPSLQIEKSESGGGQVYWNGSEYAYFHQSC